MDASPLSLVIDTIMSAKVSADSMAVANYNAVRREKWMDVKAQIEQTGFPISELCLSWWNKIVICAENIIIKLF